MPDQTGRNILITGASGMIGSALGSMLTTAGYQVHALSRVKRDSPFYYQQSSKHLILDPAVPLYAVINLAGVNLAAGRWSAACKAEILESRVQLTHALATSIAVAPVRPELFLSASAIGYYGPTGSTTATENSPPGNDFLAGVAQQWEQATAPAENAGINTIHLRFGVVLSKRGGMLQQLLLPYKLGLGGPVGTGDQYLSWISIADVEKIVLALLRENPQSGPLNLVAQPVTNADFSAQLGNTLDRPSFLRLPALVVRLLFGEMGEALLLGSNRVTSIKLPALGIPLDYPSLAAALRNILLGSRGQVT